MVGIVRQRLLPVLLALLAILAWWLSLTREGPRLAQDAPPGEPDQVVEGLRITTLDEAGRPQRRLVAREARHYPGGAGSELDAPRLTLFTAEGPPWRLKSERGWVAEEAAEIRLRGEVFLDREAWRDSPPVQITTQELQVWPQEHYGRTQTPLRATRGADWLTSVGGGEAWFGETLRARLFGRVSLEFHPPPRADSAPPEASPLTPTETPDAGPS